MRGGDAVCRGVGVGVLVGTAVVGRREGVGDGVRVFVAVAVTFWVAVGVGLGPVPFTVTVTVPRLESVAPSDAANVNVSLPVKPIAG